MMTVYDMNTGQIIESRQDDIACNDWYASEQAQPQVELRLQFVEPCCRVHKEVRMPPALADVNPDAFLQKME